MPEKFESLSIHEIAKAIYNKNSIATFETDIKAYIAEYEQQCANLLPEDTSPEAQKIRETLQDLKIISGTNTKTVFQLLKIQNGYLNEWEESYAIALLEKYLQLLAELPPEECFLFLKLQNNRGSTVGMFIAYHRDDLVSFLAQRPQLIPQYLTLIDKLPSEKLSALLKLQDENGFTLGMLIASNKTQASEVMLDYLKLLTKLPPRELDAQLKLQATINPPNESHSYKIIMGSLIPSDENQEVFLAYTSIALPIDCISPKKASLFALPSCSKKEFAIKILSKTNQFMSEEMRLICSGRLIELGYLNQKDILSLFPDTPVFKNYREQAAFLYRKARQLNPESDANYYLACLIADRKIQDNQILDELEECLGLTTTPENLALALLANIPKESLIHTHAKTKEESIINSSINPSLLANFSLFRRKKTTTHSFEYLFEKGWKLNKQGEYLEAITYLEEATKQKRDLRALMQLAWAYRCSHEASEKATALYNEVINSKDIDKDQRKDRARLQLVLLTYQEKPAEALKLLDAVTSKDQHENDIITLKTQINELLANPKNEVSTTVVIPEKAEASNHYPSLTLNRVN